MHSILIASLILLFGCTRSPEKKLIHFLEVRYANLSVNESYKRKVIEELKEYLKVHPINDENYHEINRIIHKLKDGHVVFENEGPRTLFQSGLKFHLGSIYVKSCPTCSPQLPEGKYQIIEVDNLPITEFLKNNELEIAASTSWGEEYRLYRILEEGFNDSFSKIKLINHQGDSFTTELSWKTKEVAEPVCVSGERINDSIFKLNILSLWCNHPQYPQETRKQILDRFHHQLEVVTADISDTDFIILDLRENGGGGDQEVEYVVNTFNENPVFLYEYQYLFLRKFRSISWLSPLFKVLPTWDKTHVQYTLPQYRTNHTFFRNEMITLISHGCFSSCEGLASALKNEGRSLLLGEQTHGGIGEPIYMPIPGTEYKINIPICRSFQKDGKLFEGVGVEADIPVQQNTKEINDSILKVAIKFAEDKIQSSIHR